MKVQVRIFEGKYRPRTRFLWWPKCLPFASVIDPNRREWRWLEVATWRQQVVRSIDMAGGQYIEWKDLGWIGHGRQAE